MRKEIDSKATTLDLITLMSEGNPGAINVLMQLMKETEEGLILAVHLDDMNIRGTQIWIGYKDYCGEDIHKFAECVKTRDQGMVDKINAEGLRGNHKDKAVKSGASYKREMLEEKCMNDTSA
jgi:hypothetical protein